MSFSWKNKYISNLNSNLIVAAAALLVSVCALFISIQEIRLMRDQQRANMYPHLSLKFNYNSKGYGFILENNGNGLAKINSCQILNASEGTKNWQDIVNGFLPENEFLSYKIMSSNTITNQIIPPNSSIELVFLQWGQKSQLIINDMENLDIEICYSSLLGESWVLKTSSDSPYRNENSCTNQNQGQALF